MSTETMIVVGVMVLGVFSFGAGVCAWLFLLREVIQPLMAQRRALEASAGGEKKPGRMPL